jgi:hypothetical protein
MIVMTGDKNDMLARLKMVLPARWFGDETPILDAVLMGFASAWSQLYGLLATVKLQTRLATASGIFLDIAASDYFGPNLPRGAGEADGAYSARIRANLIAQRATRAGVVAALVSITGREPKIFEPLNPADTGGYNVNLGYNQAGGYGCASLPMQFFVTAYRPNATAVSNAGGYGIGPGGYNTVPMFYADTTEFPGMVTDDDIYAAIAGVLPAAGVAWANITN